MRARILGTGSAVPERRVTNAELVRGGERADRWVRTHLGIAERRFAAPDETTSDLAAAAAVQALAAAEVAAASLDVVLLALGDGDVVSPATAVYVQEKIGAKNAVAFDVRSACSGFVVGLALARGLVESGAHRQVLVVGADIASRSRIDWEDRTSAVLFADGAGAALVGESDDEARGFLSTVLGSDPTGKEAVGVYGGGTRAPLTSASLAAGAFKIRMDGKAVRDHVLRLFPGVLRGALERAAVRPEDIACIVTHQTSRELLDMAVREAGLDPGRLHTTVERYGNTLAASAAITLDEAAREGKVREGDLVLLAAIGGGITWGAHVLRW